MGNKPDETVPWRHARTRWRAWTPAAAELQAVRARRQAAAAQASATTGTQRRGGGDAPGEAPPPAPAPPGEGSLPAVAGRRAGSRWRRCWYAAMPECVQRML